MRCFKGLAIVLAVASLSSCYDQFAVKKANALNKIRTAPGFEYCLLNGGVDPLSMESCVDAAQDTNAVAYCFSRLGEKQKVVEQCMIVSRTIEQARAHHLNCTNNVYTGLTCDSQ